MRKITYTYTGTQPTEFDFPSMTSTGTFTTRRLARKVRRMFRAGWHDLSVTLNGTEVAGIGPLGTDRNQEWWVDSDERIAAARASTTA